MITLQKFRTRVSTLSGDGSTIISEAASGRASGKRKDPPPILLLKRKAIRVFPNGKRVAMYSSDALGTMIAIPYSVHGETNEPEDVAVAKPIKETVIDEAVVRKSVKRKKKPVRVVSKTGELSNLSKLKEIATKKNTGMIRFEDGSSIKVDSSTAKSIHRIHSMVNDDNKIKYEKMINKDRHNFGKVAAFAAGFHASIESKKKTTETK